MYLKAAVVTKKNKITLSYTLLNTVQALCGLLLCKTGYPNNTLLLFNEQRSDSLKVILENNSAYTEGNLPALLSYKYFIKDHVFHQIEIIQKKDVSTRRGCLLYFSYKPAH